MEEVRQFETYQEVADELQLPVMRIYKMANRKKLSAQETYDYYVELEKHRAIKFKGVKYQNSKEACKKLGINYEQFLSHKYRYNLTSLETIKKLYKKQQDFIVDGKKYKSCLEFANAFGFSYDIVLNCRSRRKMSSLQEVADYLRAREQKGKTEDVDNT